MITSGARLRVAVHHSVHSGQRKWRHERQVRRFSRDAISRAVNDGAKLVRDALCLGERGQDLLKLVVNAVLTRLGDPKADFDDVIDESYDEDSDTVRASWNNWD